MENITPEALDFIKEKIDEIIKNENVSEREEKIIRLRFGLDKEGPNKIKEMSKLFKVSPRKMKEEVDSIEKKIFNKLKREI